MDQRRCDRLEYIEALELERNKIQLFQRELPLCLELVTQTIEILRNQVEREEGPVLEQFIPLRPSFHYLEKEERSGDKLERKKDWLQSVQLWNQQSDDQADTTMERPCEAIEQDALEEEGDDSKNKEKEKEKEKERERNTEIQRKTRRCWSPDIHRRFVRALEQLGGAHVATPKQIRELMKVDGLTNDEVKSHLQKYRLHTKRPSSAILQSDSSSPTPQAPQFVVVGGIWVPPAEYDISDSTGPANVIQLIIPRQERKGHSSKGSSPKRPLDNKRSSGVCSAKSTSSPASDDDASLHFSL